MRVKNGLNWLIPYLFINVALCSAQHGTQLQEQLRQIASDANGKVSVACALPGSTLNCDLNPHARPPMQSVFKLPLVMAVLHRVEQGTFSLDQQVRFSPNDRILPEVYSPLQDKYPEGGVDVPLRELLRLSVSLSDNTATRADINCKILERKCGRGACGGAAADTHPIKCLRNL